MLLIAIFTLVVSQAFSQRVVTVYRSVFYHILNDLIVVISVNAFLITMHNLENEIIKISKK